MRGIETMIQEGQMVIYGAGRHGCELYEFFLYKGWDRLIYSFCDKNYDKIDAVHQKKVYSYQEIRGKGKTFLISVVDKKASEEIENFLNKNGEKVITFDEILALMDEDRVAFNRDFCAFSHTHAEDYFGEAEKQESIEVFWNSDSDFYKFFQELDLTNVIELACGRGRHVPQYQHYAGNIVLVDILQNNINYCKKRFYDLPNVHYYCNNGYNLDSLKTGQYTALFSYDAMVHFELMDIYEYLKDIYRVLADGGRGLIHHSNYASDYKASFANGLRNRSFMSKDIFAYLAHRSGFTVLNQKIIDWYGCEALDCITLLEKQSR